MSKSNALNWQYLLNLCERNGCEFHFPLIEEQKRLAYNYATCIENRNEISKATIETKESNKLKNLNIGDFYITKHSNMSQVHAIFHLATNEKPNIPINNSKKDYYQYYYYFNYYFYYYYYYYYYNKIVANNVFNSPSNSNKTLKQSDLSSRHPVILGLRNILKTCITNNINTLTLPLLLTHEMNEVQTLINILLFSKIFIYKALFLILLK